MIAPPYAMTSSVAAYAAWSRTYPTWMPCGCKTVENVWALAFSLPWRQHLGFPSSHQLVSPTRVLIYQHCSSPTLQLEFLSHTFELIRGEGQRILEFLTNFYLSKSTFKNQFWPFKFSLSLADTIEVRNILLHNEIFKFVQIECCTGFSKEYHMIYCSLK